MFYRFLPTNVCNNLTHVERSFELLKRGNEIFNESQKYIVTFNKRFQCQKTANIIRKGRLSKRLENATGTLHNQDCTGADKILLTTLNLEGLEYVSTHKMIVNCR